MKHPRSTLIAMYQNRSAYYASYADKWRTGYLGRWKWLWNKSYVTDQIQQFQTLAEIYALTARMLAGTETDH